jgi:hypothetical protein
MRLEADYVHDRKHSCTKEDEKKLSLEVQNISYED